MNAGGADDHPIPVSTRRRGGAGPLARKENGAMTASGEEKTALDEIGHPKGTLAIVAIYGLLFAAGWIALFFFYFLPRGAPQP